MKINRLNWVTYSIFAFVLALVLFPTTTAFAQTQDTTTPTPTETPSTEVEQLKKRLQQLEQTVVELKGQIDAIEKKKSPAPAVINATFSALPAAAPEAPHPTEPAPAKRQDDAKGESTFEVYGFAMLDA